MTPGQHALRGVAAGGRVVQIPLLQEAQNLFGGCLALHGREAQGQVGQRGRRERVPLAIQPVGQGEIALPRHGQDVQQDGLAFVVGVVGRGDLVPQVGQGLVIRLVYVGQIANLPHFWQVGNLPHDIAGLLCQRHGPHDAAACITIARRPGRAGPAPAAVVVLRGKQQAHGTADAAIEGQGLGAARFAAAAQQFLQTQRGHHVARGRFQPGGQAADFQLAPRRGGEHDVQQAPLDRRADEDLHAGRLRRHALGGFQPDGAIGGARTARGSKHRHAVGPQRHRALHDIFVTGRANNKLKLHVDLRCVGLRVSASPRLRVLLFRSLQFRLEPHFAQSFTRHLDGLRLLHFSPADRRPQHDFNLSLLDRVVMHGDGDFGRVAVGEGQRQPDLAEEVLLHGQVVGRLAGQGLGGEALGQELPGGRTLGHRQADRRRAVLAGGNRWVPVAGLLWQEGREQDRAGRVELGGHGRGLLVVELAVVAQADAAVHARVIDDENLRLVLCDQAIEVAGGDVRASGITVATVELQAEGLLFGRQDEIGDRIDLLGFVSITVVESNE